jgi:hypothetical protein
MNQLRVKVLGLLIAALAISALAVVPAMAAEGSPEAGSPTAPSKLGPAAQSECPENAVCAWSGKEFNGTFSWWPASNTGCHSHAGNPNLRSFWNRTGYWVRLGGWGNLEPHQTLWFFEGSITGEICWPA